MPPKSLLITPQTPRRAIGTFYAPTSVLTHRTATPLGRKTVYQLDDDTYLHTGSGHHVFIASSGKPRDFNPRLVEHAARVSVFVKDGQRLLQQVQRREVTDNKVAMSLIDSLVYGGVTLFSPFYEVENPELAWQDNGPEQSLDAARETLGIDGFSRIDPEKILVFLKNIFTINDLVHYRHPCALENTTAFLKFLQITPANRKSYFFYMLRAYCTDPTRNQPHFTDTIRNEIPIEAFLESLYVGALGGSDYRGPEVQALRTIVEAYWKKEGKAPFQPQPKTSLSIGNQIFSWLLKH